MPYICAEFQAKRGRRAARFFVLFSVHFVVRLDMIQPSLSFPNFACFICYISCRICQNLRISGPTLASEIVDVTSGFEGVSLFSS